jgi:hypothetical protein
MITANELKSAIREFREILLDAIKLLSTEKTDSKQD